MSERSEIRIEKEASQLRPLTLEEITFPAHERFTEEGQIALGTLIRDAQVLQPKVVIATMEEMGVHSWDRGAALKINQAERQIKARACSLIAIKTMRLLGADLPSKEIVDLVLSQGLEYEAIPQAVLNKVSEKSK